MVKSKIKLEQWRGCRVKICLCYIMDAFEQFWWQTIGAAEEQWQTAHGLYSPATRLSPWWARC